MRSSWLNRTRQDGQSRLEVSYYTMVVSIDLYILTDMRFLASKDKLPFDAVRCSEYGQVVKEGTTAKVLLVLR